MFDNLTLMLAKTKTVYNDDKKKLVRRPTDDTASLTVISGVSDADADDETAAGSDSSNGNDNDTSPEGCHNVRSICSGSYSFSNRDGCVILDQRPKSELYVPSFGYEYDNDDDDEDDCNGNEITTPPSFLPIDANNIYKQSPTPIETDTLINESLTRFNSILDTIEIDEKHGYLMAKEKCPDLCDDSFKLIFLRCEVFNVEKSVCRFVQYWNMRLEVFGEELAFLPMTLDGAMKQDVDAMQLQYLQLAKDTTDPYGRSLLLFDFNVEGGSASSKSLLRVVWYQVHQALMKESVQKQGVVVYVRCLDSMKDWRPSLSKHIVTAGQGILPVRFAGMHFMNPPTFLSIIMRFIKPLVGKKLRHRFYSHSGETVDDVLASLDKFGLGRREMLPVSYGGLLEFV